MRATTGGRLCWRRRRPETGANGRRWPTGWRASPLSAAANMRWRRDIFRAWRATPTAATLPRRGISGPPERSLHRDGPIWCRPACDQPPAMSTARSEEHTSELQSLMRNSYDVFCLKKKKTKKFKLHRFSDKYKLNMRYTQVNSVQVKLSHMYK